MVPPSTRGRCDNGKSLFIIILHSQISSESVGPEESAKTDCVGVWAMPGVAQLCQRWRPVERCVWWSRKVGTLEMIKCTLVVLSNKCLPQGHFANNTDKSQSQRQKQQWYAANSKAGVEVRSNHGNFFETFVIFSTTNIKTKWAGQRRRVAGWMAEWAGEWESGQHRNIFCEPAN